MLISNNNPTLRRNYSHLAGGSILAHQDMYGLFKLKLMEMFSCQIGTMDEFHVPSRLMVACRSRTVPFVFNLFLWFMVQQTFIAKQQLAHKSRVFLCFCFQPRSSPTTCRGKWIIQQPPPLRFSIHEQVLLLLYCKFNRAWTNFYSLYDFIFIPLPPTWFCALVLLVGSIWWFFYCLCVPAICLEGKRTP